MNLQVVNDQAGLEIFLVEFWKIRGWVGWVDLIQSSNFPILKSGQKTHFA